MKYKKFFYITLCRDNKEFPGVMQDIDIVVTEGTKVSDLIKILDAEYINGRDEIKFERAQLDFSGPLGEDVLLIPGHGYQVVNPKKILKGNIEKMNKKTKGYSHKIPGTHYLMPPNSENRYKNYITELVNKLHK